MTGIEDIAENKRKVEQELEKSWSLNCGKYRCYEECLGSDIEVLKQNHSCKLKRSKARGNTKDCL